MEFSTCVSLTDISLKSETSPPTFPSHFELENLVILNQGVFHEISENCSRRNDDIG